MKNALSAGRFLRYVVFYYLFNSKFIQRKTDAALLA